MTRRRASDDSRRRANGDENDIYAKTETWSVRVLPKVSFGTHPSGEDGVRQDDPGVLVAHKFGLVEVQQGWSGAREVLHGLAAHVLAQRRFGGHRRAPRARPRRDRWYAMPPTNENRAYPVSCASHDLPFDALTHLQGTPRRLEGVRHRAQRAPRGEMGPGPAEGRGGGDAARRPTSADALVGSLETFSFSSRDDAEGENAENADAETPRAALVDVGAGLPRVLLPRGGSEGRGALAPSAGRARAGRRWPRPPRTTGLKPGWTSAPRAPAAAAAADGFFAARGGARAERRRARAPAGAKARRSKPPCS